MNSFASYGMWLGFIALIVIMLGVDMFMLGGRKVRVVSTKEAFLWVIVWISVALLFNCILWYYLLITRGVDVAHQKSLEFLTGYLIEKALSVDNLFVFVMVFAYFKIPAEYQRRVLVYGILGAIVMRCIMILAGAWLISQFHAILYLFGAFLVFTGIKMLIFADKESDLNDNIALKWMRGHMRITNSLHKEKFMVMRDGLLYFTPLFVVLVLIEISDVIFAVDSIPAIFAITKDPFIVFTSNIMAILGLRSLYFLLVNMIDKFYMLKYALAIILIFIGSKMLIASVLNVPIGLSLIIVVMLLFISIILSILFPKRA